MSIQKSAAPLSTSCMEEHSTCEACGDSFTCGATLAGCWCTQLKLSEQSLATLRARYKACLCRSCLKSFAEAEQQQHEEAASDNLQQSP